MRDLTITFEATNAFGHTRKWEVVNSTALYGKLLDWVDTEVFTEVEISKGVVEEIPLQVFKDFVHSVGLVQEGNSSWYFPTRDHSSTNELFPKAVDHYHKELYHENILKIKSVLIEIKEFVDETPSLFDMLKNIFKKDPTKVKVLVQY